MPNPLRRLLALFRPRVPDPLPMERTRADYKRAWEAQMRKAQAEADRQRCLPPHGPWRNPWFPP